MKRRQLLYLLGLATVSGSIAVACGDNPGGNTTSPTPGTTGTGTLENELVIYSGRDEKLIGKLIQQFEQETGAKVQVRYGDTAELAAALQEEGQNSPADIFFAQDAGALGAIQNAGMAAQLPDTLLNRVDARYRSPQGRWIGITGRARTVDYNTNLVKAGELPDTILGFTDPRWKGRIGWAPTNGSFQSFVTALRVSQGEEQARKWLEGIQANSPKDYGKNSAIIEALSRGEIAVGFVNHYYLERFKQENPNAPIAHHFLNDVGSLVNVAGIALLGTASHPNIAQRFIDFMLGQEAQQYFVTTTYEYPLAEGAPSPQGLQPLAQIKTPEIDLSNLNDLEGTLKLMQQTGVL